MTDDLNDFDELNASRESDPIVYFNLGRRCLESRQFDEAVSALQRAIALDSKLSRAYLLLARAQIELDRQGEANASLRQGVLVAHQRGDLLVKNDILDLLRARGESVPAFDADAPREVGPGQVFDRRTMTVGKRMPRPPFRNALGAVIQNNVSLESWREAVAHGTKVINELRLPMHDPQAQRVWDQHIVEFLNIGDLLKKPSE
jgi:Fe-S cluster biosynthesis and repair protein YggX